jgi:hypothetical protein
MLTMTRLQSCLYPQTHVISQLELLLRPTQRPVADSITVVKLHGPCVVCMSHSSACVVWAGLSWCADFHLLGSTPDFGCLVLVHIC